MGIAGKIRSKIHIVAAVVAILFAFGTVAHARRNADYTIYSHPRSLSFSLPAGGASTTQDVNINDTTPGPLPFTVTVDQPWITVSATSGTTKRGGIVLQFGVDPNGLNAGSYAGNVILTASGVSNSPFTIPVRLTVTPGSATAPEITMQPSSKSITAGQTATFSVMATGTSPMTYYWSKNGVVIAGASSPSYTTPSETVLDNNAQFTVKVRNSLGSVISRAAVLTVHQVSTGTPETIRAIAGLSFTGASGSTIAPRSFTVSDSSPINASFRATTDQPWLSIASATSTTVPGNSVVVAVNTAGLPAGTHTGHAMITIPDQGGYTWTNSSYPVSVTLTVTSSAAVAPTITTQPSSKSIASGQTATFNVAATGTSPITYQWSKNANMIGGATSSSYTTPAQTASDNNSQFTVAVSNVAGNANSNMAVLTVNAAAVAPTITTQPASQTVIAGKTATFTVGASSASPVTYQWSQNGTAIGGATSSSFTTPAETSADNKAQFTVLVSNSGGSATSNAAILTVSATSLILNSSSSSLNFGNVNVSSNSSQNVTFTNAGNSSITISNVTVSGSGFNASGVSSGLILTPGQTATVTATFAPSGSGSVTGSVSVASNASNSPDSISLSGTGVAAVNHSVNLTWSPSTSAVVGYNAYSATQSGGPYTKLTNTPTAALAYTDTSVQTGQTYYFVVTSIDSQNVESVHSAEANVIVP